MIVAVAVFVGSACEVAVTVYGPAAVALIEADGARNYLTGVGAVCDTDNRSARRRPCDRLVSGAIHKGGEGLRVLQRHGLHLRLDDNRDGSVQRESEGEDKEKSLHN